MVDNSGENALCASVVLDPSVSLKCKDLAESFSIEDTVRFLEECEARHVCLQFPDWFLPYSFDVVSLLKDRVQMEIHVLADSTFGSCCVDEKSMRHIPTKCIIHYGPACSFRPRNVQVQYMFPSAKESSDTVSKIQEQLLSLQECIDGIVFNQSEFSNVSSKELGELCNCEAVSDPHELETGCKSVLLIGHDKAFDQYTKVVLSGRCKYQFDPFSDTSEVVEVNDLQRVRLLKRRYFHMLKAKESNVIGIIIGTFSSAIDVNEAVERLRNAIRNAGKKSFVLSMGKPTLPKLANFHGLVDIFVMIACPQTTLLTTETCGWDPKECPLLVCTPWELLLALEKNGEWPEKYVLDWRYLDNGLKCVGASQVENEYSSSSLLTGERHTLSSLGERVYHGIDSNTQEGIVPGRSGVAEDYGELK